MTTSQLKYTALIFMTIDHIGAFIPGTPIWLHYIGRLAAPIFFFVAVEGIMHTVNRKKYLLRLYISSVLMSAAECLLSASHLCTGVDWFGSIRGLYHRSGRYICKNSYSFF